MSLFRRGDVWWCQVYRDGVRHQFSTGTGNRRQAEAVEDKFKRELHAKAFGLVDFDPTITIGTLVAHYMAKGKPSVYHTERIKQFLPCFADVQANRLTRGALADYRNQRLSGGVKDATVNRDLSVLRRVLNWSIDEQLIPANPLGRLKLARERRFHRPIMSVREEQQVLAAAPEYLRNFIIAALDLGMRKGELLGQRNEHIDFDRNLLAVSRSKTPEGDARELPFTARVREILLKLHKPSGVVFTFQGQPILDNKKGWAATLKRAGVRHFRVHDLRHTANVRWLESGTMADVRMALLGHMSAGRVHDRYTHISIHEKRAAMARLEAWYKQQLDQLKGENNGTAESSTANATGCSETE